jgi:hypothetical protein
MVWRRITLVSSLPPQEALKALEGAIQSRRGWKDKLLSTGSGKFTGEVTGDRFDIIRDIAYRNSYLPHVRGTITPGSPASRIEVSMVPDAKVLIFMALWLGLLVFNGINVMRAMNSGHAPQDYTFLKILGGMALFVFALSQAGFWPEARKAETFLKETLKAERDVRPDPSRQAI